MMFLFFIAGGIALSVLSVILLVRFLNGATYLLGLLETEEPELFDSLHSPRIFPNRDSFAHPVSYLRALVSFTMWIISGGPRAANKHTGISARKVRYLMILGLVTFALIVFLPFAFVSF